MDANPDPFFTTDGHRLTRVAQELIETLGGDASPYL
jgi:hypothetical protein